MHSPSSHAPFQRVWHGALWALSPCSIPIDVCYRRCVRILPLLVNCQFTLCCDRSSCIATVRPVGIWWIRTALSVVFTCWPPAPDDLYTSIRRSESRICTSTCGDENQLHLILLCTNEFILFYLGRLWHDRDGDCWCMYPTLSFSSRDSLYSVNPDCKQQLINLSKLGKYAPMYSRFKF